ncbi:MAG: Xaa-Pro aminopeptidase [Sporanaerobacter sp.]|jgi:Xaa-Pro aminopeptidase|uniref:M24 family metallopeptidase n=1 Tax=Sporanaerobacter sp. TaxID=2010183 RepID=UPI003A0FEC04
MTRIEKLYEQMSKNNIDGLFLLTEPNVRYISRFTGSDSFVFITSKNNYFITDSRYTEQAQSQCKGFEVIRWGNPFKSLVETVKDLVKKDGVKRIGFEKEYMNFGMYESLRESISNIELVPTSYLVEEIRVVKDEEEIECIKRACDFADKAFEKILKIIKVGMTEMELALELEYYMRKAGAEGISFDTIFISGKKTSLPHGQPSDKKIENGDFITIDFGALYKGYHSDMTRTVVVGKANEKQVEIYNIVKAAQQRGLDVLRSGISGKEADTEVRKIMGEYNEYFGHGLGHGVGLELHEIPFMGVNCDRVLEENSVVTVEPGIYIPDWGGVRIEDSVVVKKDGIEILTHSPKELIIL